MFVSMDGCAQVCVCVHAGACAHVNVEATIRGLPLFTFTTLCFGTGFVTELEFVSSSCQ